MRENGSMLFGAGCLSCRLSLLGTGPEQSAKSCTPDGIEMDEGNHARLNRR